MENLLVCILYQLFVFSLPIKYPNLFLHSWLLFLLPAYMREACLLLRKITCVTSCGINTLNLSIPLNNGFNWLIFTLEL